MVERRCWWKLHFGGTLAFDTRVGTCVTGHLAALGPSQIVRRGHVGGVPASRDSVSRPRASWRRSRGARGNCALQPVAYLTDAASVLRGAFCGTWTVADRSTHQLPNLDSNPPSLAVARSWPPAGGQNGQVKAKSERCTTDVFTHMPPHSLGQFRHTSRANLPLTAVTAGRYR